MSSPSLSQELEPRQPRAILIAVAWMLAWSTMASAANYYASPSGSGSTCTNASPCSLATAYGRASTGDSVFVKGGNYGGLITRSQLSNDCPHGPAAPNGITVKAAPGEVAEFTGNCNQGSNITFDGNNGTGGFGIVLRWKGPTTGPASESVGLFVGGSNNTYQNMEITGFAYGMTGGGQRDRYINLEVHNITPGDCYNNGKYNPNKSLCHGFYPQDDNMLFDRLNVYDCFGGYGWQVSTRHTGHIIRNSRFNNTKEGIEPSDALVYNNIISNTYHGFGLTQYYAPNKVYNNTFYNNAAGDVYGRNDLRNNIFQSARVRGNVTTQSGFVNAAGGDFHLTSSSAARGIGSNLSSVFTTDKDGVRHPSTGAWDVGAYQFTTAPRAVHRR